MKLYHIILSLILIFISGCQEKGSSDSSNVVIPDSNIRNYSKYIEVELGRKQEIEFGGSITKLKRVYEYGDCSVDLLHKKTIEAFFNTPSLCVFSFENNKDNENTKVTLFLNSTQKKFGNQLLRPLVVDYLDNDDIHLSLKEKLTNFDIIHDKRSKLLDTAFLVNRDGDILPISTLPEAKKILIPGGELQNFNMLLYAVKDWEGQILKGSVYLNSKSNNRVDNQPPYASNAVSPVPVGTESVIDLADYVSDLDGDKLQLIDLIYSDTGAKIDVPNIADLNNLKFTVTPLKSGAIDLNYSVSDHRGGLASSLIRLNATGSASGLSDIPLTAGKVVYTYPENVTEAQNLGHLGFSGTVAEDGTHGITGSYPQYSFEYAQALCEVKGGKLASDTELKTLFAQEGDLFKSNQWPTTSSYMSYDNVTLNPVTVDMKSGLVTGGTMGYVTCVKFKYDSIRIMQALAPLGHPTQLTTVPYLGINDVQANPLIKKWSVDDETKASISKSGVITGLNKGTVTVTATTVDGISGSRVLQIAENLLIYEDQDPYFERGVDMFNLVYSESDDILGGSCDRRFEAGIGVSVDTAISFPQDRFCASNGVNAAFSGKGYFYQYYGQKSNPDGPEVWSSAPQYSFLNPSMDPDPEKATDTYQFSLAINVNTFWNNEVWPLRKITQKLSLYETRYILVRDACIVSLNIGYNHDGYNISFDQDALPVNCGASDYRPFKDLEAVYNRDTGWLLFKGFIKFGTAEGGGVIQGLPRIQYAPWINFSVRGELAEERILGGAPLDELVIVPYYGDI